MSRPESVSSRIASCGWRRASCRISLRFFSPPEKPALTSRERKSGDISTVASFSESTPKNSRGSYSSRPWAWRRLLTARRRKSVLVTPGISTGYWKARKTPCCARSWGSRSKRSPASYVTPPAVTAYAGWPTSTLDSVDFPEPFGPMMACTSPLRTVRSTPLRIGVSATEAQSPLTSSKAAASAAQARGCRQREPRWAAKMFACDGSTDLLSA
mmetsp:Transcript_15338/g.33295  ORF Transcript_15338/g.33295 Transcript_15338/m.33295 type:complete len:213 (+) Transcript_15338:190-828(+)